MKTPPLLPEETLQRVLRVANFNGLSVMAISGMFALAAASAGDYVGTAIGLLIAASGAMELHGAGLLRAGDSRGMSWLIGSQPYLLVVVLAYCVVRMTNYDPSQLQRAVTPNLRAAIENAGYDEAELLRKSYVIGNAVLVIATIIYQGLMTWFYARRKHAVLASLEGESDERRFN
jgi:hypothetical protein